MKLANVSTPFSHIRYLEGGKNYDEYSSESSSTSDSSDDEETDTQKMSKSRRNKENLKKEIERKQNHPARIHDGLIFNEPGMVF